MAVTGTNFKLGTNIMDNSAKTKTIGINVKQSVAEELAKRAASMGISTSKYAKAIIQAWLSSGKKLNISE